MVSYKGKHGQILQYIFLLLHQIYRMQFGGTLAPIQPPENTSSRRQTSQELAIFQRGNKTIEATLKSAKVM